MNQPLGIPFLGRLNRNLPKDQWLYPLLFFFILLILFSARLIRDADFGTHLRGGEWILQNLSFPRTDSYTYTVPTHEYLDMHWLYQVLLYLLYKVGSYPTITLFNIVLLLGVFGVTYLRLGLTGAPSWLRVLLLFCLLLGSESRFQPRPEIATWLCMSLVLWVLEKKEKKDLRFLSLLPLIQLAWVNTESLFAVGFVLMAAFIPRLEPFKGLTWDKKLAGYLAASIGVCLLNPYFIKGLIFPILEFTFLKTGNIISENDLELKHSWAIGLNDSPSLASLDLLVYKFYCLVLVFLLAATWKKRKTSDWLLSLSFFYLSAVALRNIPLFLLVTVPIAASCWRDLPRTWTERARKFLDRPSMAFAFCVFFFLFGCRVVTNAFYASSRDTARFGLGLDNVRLPVKAAQFLADHSLNGRILNQFNCGGWLAWKGPQKTFGDGRWEVLGEEFFAEYKQGEGPGGLGRLINHYKPDILFFCPYFDYPWVSDLYRMPDWRLVYLDDYFAVFLRKGYAPQVPALDFKDLLRERGLQKTMLDNLPALLQRPRPNGFLTWLEGFGIPQDFPDGPLNLAIFNYLYHQPTVSAVLYLDSIQKTNGRYPEFFINLGSLLFDAKLYDWASACEKRALQDDPSNPVAHKILEEMARMGH